MRLFRLNSHSISVIPALALITLLSACSKPPAGTSSDPGSATARARAPGNNMVRTIAGLGDLSAFRVIAADVATDIDKGDLALAKARIKDLELAWDAAEAGLKPRAAGDWHVLDKAIDRALDALRADQPTQAGCKAAMSDLLRTFNALHSPT